MDNIDLLITLTQHEKDANNVTIAFTMGLQAAKKGYDVELILLSDAVNLVEKNYADKIDIGEPFKSLSVLLPEFIEAGGQIKVCSACMIHNKIKEKDLIDNIEIISAEYVVDALMEAKKSLQLN